MKSKKLFWGLFFVAAGVLVLVSQLGYLSGVNIFSLLITIFLIPVIIESCLHLNFGGILFPLAILGIIYAEPLGITALVPWPILITALLGTIGLSLIFSRYAHHYEHFNTHNAEVIDSEDADNVSCKVSFGASIKYVNTDDFKKGVFSASFGSLKVYFDKAKIQEETADIYIETSFAGVELYIPKEWKIVNKVNTSFGAVEEKNLKPDVSDKIVTLHGNLSFGGIEIIYI